MQVPPFLQGLLRHSLISERLKAKGVSYLLHLDHTHLKIGLSQAITSPENGIKCPNIGAIVSKVTSILEKEERALP